MVRKHCAIMKVNIMLNITVIAVPAERVSSGNISLGINQPSGPHDHANAATYVHIRNTTKFAPPLVNCPSPVVPYVLAMKNAVNTCNMKLYKKSS